MISHYIFILVSPLYILLLLFLSARTSYHDNSRIAKVLSLQFVLLAIWLTFNLAQFFTQNQLLIVWLAKMTYVPISILPITWFMFSHFFTGTWTKINKYISGLSIINAVIVIGLNWSTEIHGLIWKSYFINNTSSYSYLTVIHGWYFWFFAIWSYLLIFAGSGTILFQFIHSKNKLLFQSICIILAAIFPLLSNVIYLLNSMLGNYLIDFTPWFYAISLILFYFAYINFQIFTQTLGSKISNLSTLNFGMIEIDESRKITYVNPFVEKMCHTTKDMIVGRQSDELFQLDKYSSFNLESQPFYIFEINNKSYMLLFLEIRSSHSSLALIFEGNSWMAEISKLKHRADHDNLTGTLNKHSFLDFHKSRLSQNQIYSLIFIDIDHFKNINDQYGHLAGDELLVQLARILIREIRNEDLIGRFGGEEFTVCLPNIGKLDAIKIAQRLVDRVNANEFEINRQMINISISCGVASNEEDQDLSINEILDKADQKMYRAKINGRNRVEI